MKVHVAKLPPSAAPLVPDPAPRPADHVHTVSPLPPEQWGKVIDTLWPAVKATFPGQNPVIDGIDVAIAGTKFWEQLTAGNSPDRVRVALAGAKLGVEAYDVLAHLAPGLRAADPYRSVIGVIIRTATDVYAAYITTQPGLAEGAGR